VTLPTRVRRSAMYRRHQALHATFMDVGDWQVAEVYTSAAEELAAAERGVGLADVSAGGKLAVRGEALEAVVAKIAGLVLPPPRRTVHGRVDVAEILVCRLAPDELLVTTAPAGETVVHAALSAACESAGCAHVTDLTSAFAAVDLIGPRVPALLARLVAVELTARAAPPLSVTLADVAGVRGIIVRLEHRHPAFRLLVGREHGEFVWDTLLETGHDLGLVPVGADAHRRLLMNA
jgi:heterotetrameric sarcosine oxidase gamma subunit